MSKKNELDQYYTSPEYAAACYEMAKPYLAGLKLLEPCVGAGAFYSLMPESLRYGLDLDPKIEGIRKADFTKVKRVNGLGKGFGVLTNPPFHEAKGRKRLDVAFFNKAASLGMDVFAAVVPRSFARSPSVMNQLDKNFHLVLDVDAPEYPFILDGAPYKQTIRCSFVVFVRKDTKRASVKTTHPNKWFKFLTKKQASTLGNVCLVVEKSHRKSGLVRGIENVALTGKTYKADMQFFIEPVDGLGIDDLAAMFAVVAKEFDYLRTNKVTIRSINKGEITNVFNRYFGKYKNTSITM